MSLLEKAVALEDGHHIADSVRLPVDPLVSIWDVERTAEISAIGPRAGCGVLPGASWLWVPAWGSLEPCR